jgi:hypothetical protein
MSHRTILTLAGATLVAATFACSGSTLGPGSVTSLPTSDSVASDASQFCTDVANYIVQNFSAIVPSTCAFAGAQSSGGVGSTGGQSTSMAECESEYNACIGEANSVDPSAVNSGITQDFVPDCSSSISKCTGVTVGQAAQCISDYISAFAAASSQITAASACSGQTPATPATPASCASLPSGCTLGGSSSVTVMSSGTGG